jgi:HD superfamily phosphohydrolase YqeK
MISRETAWDLLTKYTKSESLLKHALAVEILMRAYARKHGEDEEIAEWAADLARVFDEIGSPRLVSVGADFIIPNYLDHAQLLHLLFPK